MNLDVLAARARLGTIGRPTAGVVTLFRTVIRPIVNLMHRPVVEGFDNLPVTGAYLLVANHSGVLGASEIGAFIVRYLEHVGPERPLAGFVHPLSYYVWPVSALMRALGSVPSTHAAGEAALAAGVPILVFPGGDHEVFRPIWQAYLVDFGGRTGFLKLARKARVPIVPMGFRGSHFSAPILWRSRWILPRVFVFPALLGIKRVPLTLLAVLGAVAIIAGLPQFGTWRWPLAFLWLTSPLTLLPWVPWSIRARIGKPIQPEELFDIEGARDEDLRSALVRVEAEVRALVAK